MGSPLEFYQILSEDTMDLFLSRLSIINKGVKIFTVQFLPTNTKTNMVAHINSVYQ